MRLFRACGSDENQEAGVAVIEFALVAPILLVLLIGMLEFGKAFNYWIDQTHLASSGARLAVVNGKPDPSCTYPGNPCLQNYIQSQADTRELKNGNTTSVPTKARVCITFPPVTGHSSPLVGDPVNVTVSVGYNWLPIIGERIAAGSSTISGSSTMRLEAAPTNFGAGCST
jgi:Flp pilus assembly protein TadG